MIRRVLGALRPRTFRARLALTITAALLITVVVVQGSIFWVVDERVADEVDRVLSSQASAVAARVAADPGNAAAQAREAQDLIADARIVVEIDGTVVFWTAPSDGLGPEVTATDGPVEVTLQRRDPASTISGWLLALLVIEGLIATGIIIWIASAALARRLRRSVGELTETAEAVAEGEFSVRAPVSSDEIGRLAVAFNRMTARLEAADERQRAFLADAAHELRTPVTAIEGFAEALTDGTARSEEDRAEAAQFIRQEAARLRELVRDLQELTWLDLDPPVSWQRVDLGEVVEESLARLRPRADDAGVTLAGRRGAPVVVETDPAHVATILSNLIDNAVKACDPGATVTVSAGTGPAGALVEVADEGQGIPAEHLPYLFERLYRVHPDRDRTGGGSGLGLSIVRRLATLLGGRATARSEVGKGSVFTVWLPASPPAGTSAPPASPAREEHVSG